MQSLVADMQFCKIYLAHYTDAISAFKIESRTHMMSKLVGVLEIFGMFVVLLHNV